MSKWFLYLFKIIKKDIFTLVSFTLGISFSIYAQQIELECISTKHGLSQSSIASICQDSIGFLWLGTYDGLNRYDGYEYKIFRHDSRNPYSISHNCINTLCVDKQGNLWIGTAGGGLNYYDQEKEIFISFQFNLDNSNSISNNSITSLLEDNLGNLWIGTQGGGLNRFSLSNFYKNLNKSDSKILPDIKFKSYQNSDVGVSNDSWNQITNIYQDRKGYIWVGTRYGLSQLDPKREEFAHFLNNPKDPSSINDNYITSISEDKYGNLWIGTWNNGLNKYIYEKQNFIQYPCLGNNEHGPSFNMIMCIYKDRSEDLWIGTWGGGLNKLIPSQNTKAKDRFIHYTDNPNDKYTIQNLSIYSIYEDLSGVLWIGTDWNGLYKYVKIKNKFKHFYNEINQFNSLTQNTIFDIHKDRNCVLWIATRNSGLTKFDIKNNQYQSYTNSTDDTSSINHNKVRVICEDRNGNLWIGTEIFLDRYDYENNKFIHYILNKENPYETNVFCIRDDRYRYLWIGTYGSGLYRLNLNNNNFTHYTHDINNPKSIGDNIIWYIHEDRSGNLWIGTDNGGINLYDRENDQFIRYKHDPDNPKSLSGNKVLTIFEDQSGQMWFGTTAGLNRLEMHDNKKSELNFTHYTIYDGLPTSTIHAILEDDQRNLWISTNNGLSKFNPETETFNNFDISDGLQDMEFSVNSCYKDTLTGELYFGGINGFNVFHPDSIQYNTVIPKVVLTDLRILNQSVQVKEEINDRNILNHSLLKTSEITLSYSDIIFSITFSALHFSSPNNNQYAYKLDGFEKKWNYIDAKHRSATYTNLDPGEYTFCVKASNNDGVWNEKGTSLKITITPPFWATLWFKSFSIIAIILIILIAFRIRTHQIRERNKKLEKRVKDRTEELESFAYSVSHDLRTPLRGIQGFSLSLLEDYENKLESKGKKYLHRIVKATNHMAELIDDLLTLSRISRKEPEKKEIDLAIIFEELTINFKNKEPNRNIEFIYNNGLIAYCDENLIKIAIENLATNAWKFTSTNPIAKIEFGKMKGKNGTTFFIKDNGIGFEMKYADKLFEAFQRQHLDYEGTGIGLTTVQRIIQRHGGRVWAEGAVNKGATFYFTLPS